VEAIVPRSPDRDLAPAGDVAAYVRGHLEVLEGERAQNHRARSALHFEFRGEGTLRARGM